MWLLLAASAFAAGATGAVHVGTLDGNGIRWESTITGKGVAMLADGSVVELHGRNQIVRHQEGLDGLHPPLLADTWQRIDLKGLEWTPDPTLGLERRVDGWCPHSFGLAERATLEAVDPHVGFSTFVDGSDSTLPGEVEKAGRVGATTTLGVGAAFICAVVVLILARRTIQVRVRAEEAAAYMDQEFLGRR